MTVGRLTFEIPGVGEGPVQFPDPPPDLQKHHPVPTPLNAWKYALLLRYLKKIVRVNGQRDSERHLEPDRWDSDRGRGWE